MWPWPRAGLSSFRLTEARCLGAFVGLAGPALLSYLTWETAKIRSTQSATGILYVDFFTVVVGEVLAKYILLATRVPVRAMRAALSLVLTVLGAQLFWRGVAPLVG